MAEFARELGDLDLHGGVGQSSTLGPTPPTERLERSPLLQVPSSRLLAAPPKARSDLALEPLQDRLRLRERLWLGRELTTKRRDRRLEPRDGMVLRRAIGMSEDAKQLTHRQLRLELRDLEMKRGVVPRLRHELGGATEQLAKRLGIQRGMRRRDLPIDVRQLLRDRRDPRQPRRDFLPNRLAPAPPSRVTAD